MSNSGARLPCLSRLCPSADVLALTMWVVASVCVCAGPRSSAESLFRFAVVVFGHSPNPDFCVIIKLIMFVHVEQKDFGRATTSPARGRGSVSAQ